jgi:UDP-N-acetyl-D-glucosamine dehydrogenase
MHTRFIELAGEINTAMPGHVVKTVIEALNEQGKSVKGARILILGLAYKANVDDDRESPTYRLIEKLEALGADVGYHDPHIPVIPMTREHARYSGRKSVAEISADHDLILLSTAHETYRGHDFSAYDIPLVDTRNAVATANRPVKYFKA